MGKNGNWFGAVKKVFSPESKEKKKNDQKTRKLKKKKKGWGFGKSKKTDTSLSETPVPPTDEIRLSEADNDQKNHEYSVALANATAAAAEAAVAAAKAAAEVVRLTTTRVSGKSREDVAAIKIQTAFRGYLARRALRALRGLSRLKSLIHGSAVQRQAITTLRCMQKLARVQSQIHSRRIRMTEENQALQRQLQLKCQRELEALGMGEEWDDSVQSKEQVDANLMSKYEATIRRERALAYAFTHQQLKNSSRSANPMFTDLSNPQWGWSWLERWMAARPWDSRSITEKELHNDRSSVKSSSHSVGGEITKAYARRDLNAERPSPSMQKSSRPSSRVPPLTPPSKVSLTERKIKPVSPRIGLGPSEDDSRSVLSVHSERNRRHSIAGSSVRDDESLASSSAVPSYMTPTESARAKSRFQSPLSNKAETPDRGSVGSAKKRLSFPATDKHILLSPAGTRRHSGPPKVDVSSFKDLTNSENNVSN